MASKFIKIFNDTVLKQTVLQGYETQRTNDNLGLICMGELAFTRDTGRLFVGNFSTQELELDTNYIVGGVLTGNKYVGLIDSRPFCHFNGEGSTGCYPLNYEKNTSDRDNSDNTVYPDEIGLFLENSRYRPFKDNTTTFKFGGDGWNKKPEYIQKYGVYSGDYMFDIYNNALILFDKNIKINTGKTTLHTETETNPDDETQIITKEWKETDIGTGTLHWDGQVETIISPHNEDITSSSTIRTPITNIADKNNNDNISKYPIYGDGYVVMRILEPDGITIDYADRKIQDGEPVISAEDTNLNAYSNWTHNILTVNYPIDKIVPLFDDKNFHKGDNKIELGSFKNNEEELTITLPNKINIPGSGWELDESTGYDKRISFRPLKEYNNTDFNEEDPFENIDESKHYLDSCVLTITKDGQIKYKSPKMFADALDKVEIPTHTITIGNGLKLTNIDNSENASIATMGEESSNWKIELDTDDSIDNGETEQTVNPWDLEENGTYNYTLGGGYLRGKLMTTNSYEENYQFVYTDDNPDSKQEREDFTKVVTNKYQDNTLVTTNRLKVPYKLHSGSSDSKARFVNLPFISAIDKQGGTIHVPDLTGTKKSGSDTSTRTIKEGEEGNITEIIIETTLDFVLEYNFSLETITDKQKEYKVPRHANDVLLQVVHNGPCKIYSTTDYENMSYVLYEFTSAGTDIIEIQLQKDVLLESTKITGQTTKITRPDGTIEQTSLTDEELANLESIDSFEKSFQYKIETSSNFTINLLGYRV